MSKVAEQMIEQVQAKASLYEKIQRVRVGLLKVDIKKSGDAAFGKGKKYMSLDDFVGDLNRLMLENRMTAIINFTPECAILTAYDFDSDNSFSISCEMAKAKLSSGNEVQVLGATQTYMRRYLYFAMFDVGVSDAFDSGELKIKEQSKQQYKASKITDMQKKVLASFGIDAEKLKQLATYSKVKTVDDIPYDVAEKQIKQLEAKMGKKPEPVLPPQEQQDYGEWTPDEMDTMPNYYGGAE